MSSLSVHTDLFRNRYKTTSKKPEQHSSRSLISSCFTVKVLICLLKRRIYGEIFSKRRKLEHSAFQAEMMSFQSNFSRIKYSHLYGKWAVWKIISLFFCFLIEIKMWRVKDQQTIKTLITWVLLPDSQHQTVQTWGTAVFSFTGMNLSWHSQLASSPFKDSHWSWEVDISHHIIHQHVHKQGNEQDFLSEISCMPLD